MWEWDGARWTEVPLQPDQAPDEVIVGHAMAYDTARERVVLFGGGDRLEMRFFDDLWEGSYASERATSSREMIAG